MELLRFSSDGRGDMALTLWLIGWMIMIGVVVAQEEDGLKTISDYVWLIVISLALIILWPFFLGIWAKGRKK